MRFWRSIEQRDDPASRPEDGSAESGRFAGFRVALNQARPIAGRLGCREAHERDPQVDGAEIGIQIVRASAEATVAVTGRVTVDSSPHLRSVLLELLRRRPPLQVVIDLSGVSYLDMSGLASLLEALKAARQRSVVLRVLGLTGRSRMMAEVAGLDQVFRAAGSEMEFR